jgi:hypothetical protein
LNPILAYVDAGTGSLVLQLVAGGLAGLAALLRFRWASIRERFRKDRDPARPAVAEE